MKLFSILLAALVVSAPQGACQSSATDTTVITLPGTATPSVRPGGARIVEARHVEAALPALKHLTADQKAWGLAASAILTELNKDDHDTLAGGPRTAARVAVGQQTLRDQWGARDRDDLLSALYLLDKSGHRNGFQAIGKRISVMSDEEFKAVLSATGRDTENGHSLQIARQYYQQLGEKSLIGWDYARYISLCRWGYLAGYLSEDETWPRIMHAAQIIQTTFASWQEFGENYLIGRQFWSFQATRRDGGLVRGAFQSLLKNPKSPWTRISWDLDLH